MPGKDDVRERELDEFWDISSLIPDRRRPQPPQSCANVEAVEISFGDEPDKNSDSRLTRDSLTASTEPRPPKKDGRDTSPIVWQTHERQPQTCDEYTPEHSLIDRVRVYDTQLSYRYYEQFLEHAKKSICLEGNECDFVPFFSYVPQYSQLTRPQLNWYLYWRRSVWHGSFLPTDYSYILLYIYEIINTGGHGKHDWGQTQLCNIWQNYRTEYPRLDKLLSEWICDFSLIYHLKSPTDKLSKLPRGAIESCSIKEFYVRTEKDSNNKTGQIMLTYCSNYNYKTSKFAIGDAKSLYDKHIPGAMCAVVEHFASDGNEILPGVGLERSELTREAYAGALCSYEIKKRIEIEFLSFKRSYGLRYVVRDIAKYSENRIRAYLGVRSRLTVGELASEIRACIDAYFDRELPKKVRSEEDEERKYQRLYDAPKTPLSIAHAAEIEQNSWVTTERLVEAFDDGDSESPIEQLCSDLASDHDRAVPSISVPEPSEREQKVSASSADLTDLHSAATEPPHTSGGNTLSDALAQYRDFLLLADAHDFEGERRYASEHGIMLDLISDNINEIAADIFGDVILEEADGGYVLIEEYRKDIIDV